MLLSALLAGCTCMGLICNPTVCLPGIIQPFTPCQISPCFAADLQVCCAFKLPYLCNLKINTNLLQFTVPLFSHLSHHMFSLQETPQPMLISDLAVHNGLLGSVSSMVCRLGAEMCHKSFQNIIIWFYTMEQLKYSFNAFGDVIHHAMFCRKLHGI